MKDLYPIKILLVVFALALPLKTFALEISYPPFFALDKATTLGDVVNVFFSATLGIGAVVAAGYIVFLGFQILTSRGNPEKTGKTRNRITQIIIGLVILAGGTLILRTINPDLGTVHVGPITLVAGPPIDVPVITETPPAESTPIEYALGKTLDDTYKFINGVDTTPTLENTNGDLTLTLVRDRALAVKNDLFSCNESLSLYPNPIDYKTTHTDCSTSGTPPATHCSSYCGDSRACTTDICTGDPCSPGRSDANIKLGDPDTDTRLLLTTVGTFKDLQAFWDESIQPQRDRIQTCGVSRSLLDYATLSLVDSAGISALCSSTGCTQSMDFFCLSSGETTSNARKVHLPLDDPINGSGLLQEEYAFIANIDAIITDMNTCSYLNTTATSESCASGCSYNTVQCTANQNGGINGCPANTWPDLAKLEKLRSRMQTLYDSTKNLAAQIDDAGQLVIASALNNPTLQSFSAITCPEAQQIVASWQTVGCSPNSCCPDKATRELIGNCVNEDFYLCPFTPPANP